MRPCQVSRFKHVEGLSSRHYPSIGGVRIAADRSPRRRGIRTSRWRLSLRRAVAVAAAAGLTLACLLVGSGPAQAFTTGTIAPPDFLTLSSLRGGNVVNIPFTSDAAPGSTLYLTARDTGPGNSNYSKTITALSGSDGSGIFRLEFAAPADVAVGDVLYFSASDSSSAQAFSFASATQTIVAPGVVAAGNTKFFAGSWGGGLQLTGSGFPHSAQATVSVVTGSDSAAPGNLIAPVTVTTDSVGAFSLTIPAGTLDAGGLPQLPGTSNTYYRVAALDSLGNQSTPLQLTIRSVAAGTSVSPITAQPGDVIRVTAAELRSNEPLELWLHSTPIRLLSAAANSTGTFVGEVAIPGAVAAGSHQVEVRGATSGSQWLTFTVSPPPAPTPTPADPPASVPPPSPSPASPIADPVPGIGIEPSPRPLAPQATVPIAELAAEPVLPEPSAAAENPSTPPTPSPSAIPEDSAAVTVPSRVPRLVDEIAQDYTVDVVAITAIGAGLLLLGPVLVFGARIKRRQSPEDQSRL